MPCTETSPDPAATCLHTRDQQPLQQEDNFPHSAEEDGALQYHSNAPPLRDEASPELLLFFDCKSPGLTCHTPSKTFRKLHRRPGNGQPPPEVTTRLKMLACRGSRSQG